MNGADVYGRKITVCLPDESPFNLNNKKWNILSRRAESPSPQRQRNRSASRSGRSYSPEGKDQVNPSTSPKEYSLVPATELNTNRNFRTPGGPTRNTDRSVDKQSVTTDLSPNHTHMLPNSNSASSSVSRYYTKSEFMTPSDFQEKGPSQSNNKHKAIFDKLVAGAGNSVVSLSSSTQHLSLKDIPLPPSGYMHMPPPNMAPNKMAANVTPVTTTIAQGIFPSQPKNSVEPVKLFETSTKDSHLLKPGLLGAAPSDLSSCAQGNKDMVGNTTQEGAGSKRGPIQPAAYFKHAESQISGQGQGHPRSLSVPGGHEDGPNNGVYSYGGPPPPLPHHHPSHRSHSYSTSGDINQHNQYHGSNNQTQDQNQKRKGRHLSGGFTPQARELPMRPGSTGSNYGNSFSRSSPTPDSNNARPYSPSNFRPRLPSAPAGQLPSIPPPGPPPPLPIAFVPNYPPPTRPLHRQKGSNLYRVPTPVEIGDPGSDYFHPDFMLGRDPYVELIVSNLDYNITPLDWRKVIYATFQPHVKILSIQVRLQADNTSIATLRLPTEQEARFAISQYHRRKIGYKRINVQLKSDCSHSPAESLRMDTIALLMEERENKMALSRLIDLFDKRFHKTVSVSDIYKMRDTVQISESGGGGRWVKLQPGIRRTPTPTQGADGEVIDGCDQRVCSIHCPEGSSQYVEALNCCMLPNVLLLRKHFSPQLHSLLLSHNGFIPLMSFPACFAAEFSRIEPEKTGGIPLEHVISCVQGVEIVVSKVGVKVIQFQQNREPFYDLMKGSSWQELGKISREVMELLRQQGTCTMPVSKFIPAYHHYFGKQCRVADYGYTKLQELFEAIPHAIQVLGTGDRRAITLSPRAQIKRFITDIVKVVKGQPAKQIMLDKFPDAYEEVMGKPLFLPHYGVCHMEDVLSDIPTTTLIVVEEGNHVLLALPRRDQTAEEVERTKKFALEVVDLLKTCPRCCMAFNKFIPAYHHHFGRQCRVADYGYSKLADLFEAVGHVVRLEEEGEERLIQLSVAEIRSVLCEQMTSLLHQAGAIPVPNLLQTYASRYNFNLRLEDYGVNSVHGLLKLLRHHVKVEKFSGQEYVTLVKEFEIPVLGLQVMQLLMDESGGCLPLTELCTRYQSAFGKPCDLAEIKDKLTDFIQIDENEDGGGLIRLSLQQILGRNLRLLLLHRPNQRLPLGELYTLYRSQYGVDISPALYGFANLFQLLMSFPHILEVKGKTPNKYIQISNMLGTPGVLPPARVDVNSSKQSQTNGSGQETSSSASKDTLMHASQLWDSAIISHSQSPPARTAMTATDNDNSPSESTRIIRMLQASANALAASNSSRATTSGVTTTTDTAAIPNKVQSQTVTTSASSDVSISMPVTCTANPSNTVALPLSSNGVPLAWQMLTGAQKVVSGNLSNDAATPVHRNGQTEKEVANDADNEDMFSPGNRPLDTSSATSHSSQSTTGSPVKPRRGNSRIAANFKK